ncbi:aspartate dehydrogenase [Jannaschia sp. CCS1]|uniref:aspartate dehydrogenase n=1 Tax=Jannaschia sp. (strain CCS1) TaxID=290400 RepID=UPI000053D2AF|nr:aspartate dehydrogenase [Jannaschia sp. CCS1]ABD54368.1 aspartate dehydrogenase [Jannaschia sp. CCS1]
MRVGIIGKGAIAGYVTAQIAAMADVSIAARVLRQPVDGAVTDVADLPALDLLIDCAGHAGLSAHGPQALAREIDVLTLSLGALADAALSQRLAEAATQGAARLHLASGAIGALDALRAAKAGGLTRVTYTGRKPPAGWRGSPAEDVLDLSSLTEATPHFEGSARNAALRYPKNANVAAAVALAGLGFDDTQVALIADPNAAGNIHEITAEGTFGQLAFTITGNSLPDNPRSSALAAMSAIAAIRQLHDPIRFA